MRSIIVLPTTAMRGWTAMGDAPETAVFPDNGA
jgi:hypothetical protein